jgi:plasmid maintenance system antidote protein VapI
MLMTASELGELLRSVRARLGTDKALAEALGISATHVNRILERPAGMGVEICLRLAALAGANASAVLRAAGKKDIATLIEQLYGAATPAASPLAGLDDRALRVARNWARLSRPAQRMIDAAIRAALQEDRKLVSLGRDLPQRTRAAPR